MIIIMTFLNSSFEHKIINIIRLFAIIIHFEWVAKKSNEAILFKTERKYSSSY